MKNNIINALIKHGSIETTLSYAKKNKRYFDKLVTLGKKAISDVFYTRLLSSKLYNNKELTQRMKKIAEVNIHRQGGYTSIARLKTTDRGTKVKFCVLDYPESNDQNNK